MEKFKRDKYGSPNVSSHKLDNLIIILDYNKIQSDDFNKNIMNFEPLKKANSFGMNVQEIDGHKINQIKNSLLRIKKIKNLISLFPIL